MAGFILKLIKGKVRLLSGLKMKKNSQPIRKLVGGKSVKSLPVGRSEKSMSRKVKSSWLSEIKLHQRSTELLIKKRPFGRLVKEIAEQTMPGVRMTKEALMAVQEAAEAYLVEIMQKGNQLAIHAGRVTLMPRDQRLAVSF